MLQSFTLPIIIEHSIYRRCSTFSQYWNIICTKEVTSIGAMSTTVTGIKALWQIYFRGIKQCVGGKTHIIGGQKVWPSFWTCTANFHSKGEGQNLARSSGQGHSWMFKNLDPSRSSGHSTYTCVWEWLLPLPWQLLTDTWPFETHSAAGWCLLVGSRSPWYTIEPHSASDLL